jgi:hypothetical protein
MRLTVLEDAKRRPDLFIWQGAIDSARLDSWTRSRNLRIPSDLRLFWIETGGGDFFESETILGPLGRADLADDVETVNAHHHLRGLPADFLVFHRGLGGLTAIQMSNGLYVQLRRVRLLRDSRFPFA